MRFKRPFVNEWERLQAWGFTIFPLEKRDKIPPKYYRWKDNASNNTEKLRIMSLEYPANNIGIVTGAPSGIFVVDLDGQEGIEGYKAICKDKEIFKTPMAKTGGDGIHILYRHPGFQLGNTVETIGKKIDTRGDGGYIVAPGSIHPNGKKYEWLVTPSESSFAEIPEWLLELLGEGIKNRHKQRNAFKARRFGVQQPTFKEFRESYALISRHFEYEDILLLMRDCIADYIRCGCPNITHRHRHMIACELFYIIDIDGKHVNMKDMHDFFKMNNDYSYEYTQYQLEDIGNRMNNEFVRWSGNKIQKEFNICKQSEVFRCKHYC